MTAPGALLEIQASRAALRAGAAMVVLASPARAAEVMAA
jgi:hypothetical protein